MICMRPERSGNGQAKATKGRDQMARTQKVTAEQVELARAYYQRLRTACVLFGDKATKRGYDAEEGNVLAREEYEAMQEALTVLRRERDKASGNYQWLRAQFQVAPAPKAK